MKSFTKLLALAVAVAWSSGAVAAPINHGTFVGSTVQYVDVTEDSATDATPLFGEPIVVVDTLDFSPVSFASTASGADGVDITDGTLSTRIEALAGNAIPAVKIEEAGDYSLVGAGANTAASVTATFFLDIIEVDGVSIDPIKLQGSLDVSGGGQYSPSPADGLWTGSKMFDIAAELVANNVNYTLGATKVILTMDNTLATVSEAGTSALIAKKDLGIQISVPEPSSAMIAVLAGGALCFVARRRRGGR